MTEVVYRLYETVDELTTVIENARSVPMSASCMVPRDHLLDLLDDLRESLPEDVQAAGAIVEQRTEILQAAQAEAELLTRRTRSRSQFRFPFHACFLPILYHYCRLSADPLCLRKR